MRYFIMLAALICIQSCRQQDQELPKQFPLIVELFSPKSNLSLNLRGGKFSLEKNVFESYDQIQSESIATGRYYRKANTIILKSKKGKRYRLKIESGEILIPIAFEGLSEEDKFLAWNTFYDNGKIKKAGGWTKDNLKSGVWTFYNEQEKIISHKLYEKGKLVDNNFKYKK